MASQISRPIYDAVDITPASRHWTVVVQVLERSMPNDSRSITNPVKYRRCIVIDMKGTRLGIVTYGNNIPFFDATLVPFRRYYISNEFVKKAKEGFEIGEYKYIWTLTNSTLVEPLIDAETFTLPCEFEFTPFSEFSLLAETETCIALVVKAFSWKTVNDGLEVKYYVVVDHEQCGGCKKILAETYKDVSTLIKCPEIEVIISIEHVIKFIHKLKTAWIKRAIKLVPGEQKFWSTCCSNCNKNVHGDVGWTIWCEACKENTHIDLRYNFEVSMEDGTSEISVTLYAADAEKLLPFTISEFAEETTQGKDVEPKIRTAIGGRHIVCFIKHFDKKCEGWTHQEVPVIIMFYHNEVFGSSMIAAHNSPPKSPLIK